ncbi:Transposon TX1 149 kDa protein isoform E [Senna tora]|uniref:Transposon TX1 149 kDa protein isoform E n=1 Tax=Senna tora TaxID=362788 RepID=A0A834TBS4_9FABA|nr:Transposon TX1 149 kDa protein isoform E [Senna tora]
MSGIHQAVQRPSSTKTNEKSDAASKLYKPEKRDTNQANLLREKNNSAGHLHKVTILNLPQGDVDPEHQACNRNKGLQDKVVLSGADHEKDTPKFSSDELHVPILPWINGDGTMNNIVFKGLRRRILGIVMQNPGILEDDIACQMHVLNPQSCRTLLEMMILDKHLIVRKMHQNRPDGAPSLLQNLIGSKSSQPKLVCRNHFFANPLSSSVL